MALHYARPAPGLRSLASTNCFRSTKDGILALGQPRGMGHLGNHSECDMKLKWLQVRHCKKDKSWA